MTLLEQIWTKGATVGASFESRLFSNASACIDGYQGGHWIEQGAGLMGCNNAPNGPKYRLHASTNGCDVTTDMRSATVAVWVLTLNRASWRYADAGNNDLGQWFSDLYYAAQDAWCNDATLDHAAIFSFLD